MSFSCRKVPYLFQTIVYVQLWGLTIVRCSLCTLFFNKFSKVIFSLSLLGVHPVPDRCGTVRRTRRIREVKVVRINSPVSGATAVTSTTAADANRLVVNQARKARMPRQEVNHLQKKRPLPRPSRVGLSRKQHAHRQLPSFTIVRVSAPPGLCKVCFN